MHTLGQPVVSPARTPSAAPARVAIAGATGYAGQELVRLLARHPAVAIATAMSSGSAAAASRPLPSLARLWNGAVQPLSHQALLDADVAFLALPDSAAAELGPMLADAGVRTIDL